MAYYTGYVTLPVDSYANWKNATNGNGFNFDNQYGCQCYDLVVEFWHNVGFPQGYPLITNSKAYTMWENRESNIVSPTDGIVYFDLIYNVQDIKQGDVIVFNGFPGNTYGHTGFAEVDYSDWQPDPQEPNEYPILSQNNGGTPDPQGGAYTNVHGYDISLFLGAFRYKAWHSTPPVPPTTYRSHFPFVLYARKLRKLKQGL